MTITHQTCEECGECLTDHTNDGPMYVRHALAEPPGHAEYCSRYAAPPVHERLYVTVDMYADGRPTRTQVFETIRDLQESTLPRA